MLQTKVCIVGSGPAGSVASLFLSKAGVEHILVERSIFPRSKVCGESFDGRLVHILNKLDDTLITRMHEAKIIHNIHRYSYFNSKMQVMHIDHIKKYTARISTRRADFDYFLQQEAKKSPFATCVEGVNVNDAIINDYNIIVQTSAENIQANLAIIATGANSPLVKKLIPENTSSGHYIIAARGYYKNVHSPNNISSIRVHLLKKPVTCYLYIVDLPNNITTVELIVLKSKLNHYQGTPEKLLTEILETNTFFQQQFKDACLVEKIKGLSIPASSPKTKISCNRILLAGSSGLSINPSTGWGVSQAMLEAKLAAETCVGAIKNQTYSAEFLHTYDKQVHDALRLDRRLGKLSDFALKNLSNLFNTGIGMVAKNRFLANQITTIMNKM